MKKKNKTKKAKATGKKAGKKNTKKNTVGKKFDPAKVREQLARIVGTAAGKFTRAVVTKANQGQLAPAKYLLEMAGVYPTMTDGSQPTEREESLAETLLDRLKIPKTPVVHDELQKEEDEEDTVVIKPMATVEKNEDSEENVAVAAE